MRRGRLAWIAAAAAALLAGLSGAGPALAQAQAPTNIPSVGSNVSYSTWTVAGTTVTMRFSLPKAESRLLVPAGAKTTPAAAAAAAVGARVAVSTAAGPCAEVDRGPWVGKIYTLSDTPNLDRFEIIYSCPSTEGLVLHDHLLFDRQPGQVNYARISVEKGQPAVQLFTASRQELSLPAAGAPVASASPLAFARQGVARLFNGLERLCLVAGLVLLARRWSDLKAIALALGAGYLVSLPLALSGLVSLDQRLGEAVIGLTAALLGAMALRQETRPEAPSRGWRIGVAAAVGLIIAGVVAAAAAKGQWAGIAAAGLVLFGLSQLWIVRAGERFRWLVLAPAALFGLIDGMGAPGNVAVVQPLILRMAPMFIGYDIGAVAAAAGLATVSMAVVWLIGRRMRKVRGPALDAAGAALIGLGMFWFVSRLYT